MSASGVVIETAHSLTGLNNYSAFVIKRAPLCENGQLRRLSGSDLTNSHSFQKSKSVVDLTNEAHISLPKTVSCERESALQLVLSSRVFRALCGSIGNLHVTDTTTLGTDAQLRNGVAEKNRQRSHSLGRLLVSSKSSSAFQVAVNAKPMDKTEDHVENKRTSCNTIAVYGASDKNNSQCEFRTLEASNNSSSNHWASPVRNDVKVRIGDNKITPQYGDRISSCGQSKSIENALQTFDTLDKSAHFNFAEKQQAEDDIALVEVESPSEPLVDSNLKLTIPFETNLKVVRRSSPLMNKSLCCVCNGSKTGARPSSCFVCCVSTTGCTRFDCNYEKVPVISTVARNVDTQSEVTPNKILLKTENGDINEKSVANSCNESGKSSMDYCHLWNTSSGIPCEQVSKAPALPPKRRSGGGSSSSLRRLYANDVKLVSQSLDQLNNISPSALLKNRAADCGSVATVESNDRDTPPSLPPPPRPLRKPCSSISSLPRPVSGVNLAMNRRNIQPNLISHSSSSLQRTQSVPNRNGQADTGNGISVPPLLPRKTRQRHLSSVQECDHQDIITSSTAAALRTSSVSSRQSIAGDSFVSSLRQDVNGQKSSKKPPLTISIQPDTTESEQVDNSQTSVNHNSSQINSCFSKTAVTVSSTNPSPTLSVFSRMSVAAGDNASQNDDNNQNTSPAASVLRPRSGKEYYVPDRKMLVEVFGSKLNRSSIGGTMFTFDVSGPASTTSSGTNSPVSPNNNRSSTAVTPPLQTYLAQRFSEFGSKPGSPRLLNGNDQPTLNYIQLDHFSDVHVRPSVPKPVNTIAKSSGVDYTVIDMVATAAASRVAREHVKEREDSIRLKMQNESNRHQMANADSPRHKLMHSSKNNSSTSLLSKDRKHSFGQTRESKSQHEQRKLSHQ